MTKPTHPLRGGVALTRAHGAFYLTTGLWPLLHRSSFEQVSGPKTDWWLVQTVAGLLIANGVVQITTPATPDALRQARRIGIGTAAALAAIELRYAPTGRIRKIYLVDAVVEVGWIVAWARRHG